MSGPAAATLDQEVSKGMPEVTMAACPRDGHTPMPSCGPDGAKTSNCMGTPDILSCSFMTGEELKAFGEFSMCSGVSA